MEEGSFENDNPNLNGKFIQIDKYFLNLLHYFTFILRFKLAFLKVKSDCISNLCISDYSGHFV